MPISSFFQRLRSSLQANGHTPGREAAIEGLLSALPDILYVLGPDGHLEDWNEHLAEVTGYGDEQLVRMHLRDFVPSRYHEQLALLHRKIKSGEGPVKVDVAVRTKAGREVPHEFTGAAVTGEGGQVVGTVGIGRDISDRKRLEKEKRDVSRQERQWFAQELHDGTCQQLSTLSVLVATLDLYLIDAREKTRDVLKKVRTLLERTIQETRALSHGIAPIDFDEVTLEDTLEDLARETSEAYPAECTFSNEARLTVDDPETARNLYRIAQEALRNALRHGEASRVRIALRREEEEIILSVIDDGAGIDEDLLRQGCGGLGLKTMRDRARVVSGALQVKRGREGGTVVRCRFPAGKALRVA